MQSAWISAPATDTRGPLGGRNEDLADMIPICIITGHIVGDSDACGDCDPCILGASKVPEIVKKLMKEKDKWRDKYADAMCRIDELEAAAEVREHGGGYGAI